MDTIMQMIVTVVCSILASSGVWAIIGKIMDKKDNKTKLLLGLAHDRILWIGMSYIRRGEWITQDEYENLHEYLWQPYHDVGGNGSAERVIKEVEKLHIVPNDYVPGK